MVIAFPFGSIEVTLPVSVSIFPIWAAAAAFARKNAAATITQTTITDRFMTLPPLTE
jgi:hypothetical protein